MELPYACRLGCCSACTVKVKEGTVVQPHSLGLSKDLRDQVRCLRGRAGRQRRLCGACAFVLCLAAGHCTASPTAGPQRPTHPPRPPHQTPTHRATRLCA